MSCLLLFSAISHLLLPMHILYNSYTQHEAAFLQAAASGDVLAVKRMIGNRVNINCTDQVSYYMWQDQGKCVTSKNILLYL